MLENFANKIIDNLPEHLKNKEKPIYLDLVLGGGAFNGSYLIGALYFLKEMEKRGYVVIERISGCSIGSLVGLFYLIDKLDNIEKFYKTITDKFKEDYNLSSLKDIQTFFGDSTPINVCDIINDKLYISYHNIETCKKIVKKKYKDTDDLYDAIIKSSFIPYMIDGNLEYKNKYIDGINPYVFKLNKHCIKKNKKILFLDLYTLDKLYLALNIKNEKSNIHRILSGLLEINMFFIKQQSTQMCSYKNNWNITEITFYIVKCYIEKIILFILSFLLFLKKLMPCNIKKNSIFKISLILFKKIYLLILDTFCF